MRLVGDLFPSFLDLSYPILSLAELYHLIYAVTTSSTFYLYSQRLTLAVTQKVLKMLKFTIYTDPDRVMFVIRIFLLFSGKFYCSLCI